LPNRRSCQRDGIAQFLTKFLTPTIPHFLRSWKDAEFVAHVNATFDAFIDYSPRLPLLQYQAVRMGGQALAADERQRDGTNDAARAPRLLVIDDDNLHRMIICRAAAKSG
jgi:hypothetical protein